MTSKVENTIELVKNSPASLFTKEDVIKLLNDVSDVPAGDEDKVTITDEQIEELIDAVRSELSMGLDNNLVDYDSAQFELNGNKIELTDVDIDTDPIEDIAEDAIRNWFDHNVL
jgi:hypothetical protein